MSATAAVSTPPVPRFCSLRFSRILENLGSCQEKQQSLCDAVILAELSLSFHHIPSLWPPPKQVDFLCHTHPVSTQWPQAVISALSFLPSPSAHRESWHLSLMPHVNVYLAEPGQLDVDSSPQPRAQVGGTGQHVPQAFVPHELPAPLLDQPFHLRGSTQTQAKWDKYGICTCGV